MDIKTVIVIVIIIAVIVWWNKAYGKEGHEIHLSDKLNRIREKVIAVEPRAKYLNFYHNSKEAYVLGKKDVHICLNDPGSDSYYNDNMLILVALHEVAHSLIKGDTDDHPPIFDQVFSDLLERARKMGYYDPNIPFPSKYCGKPVKYYKN